MTANSDILPIFDPIIDTFDLLRFSEPFCFSVVLALGCRHAGTSNISEHVKTVCQNEAKRLATESLFQHQTSLASVQAMLLLAAYGEETWFAIGHSQQMALALELDKALPRLLGKDDTSIHSTSLKERRTLMRYARVWLALCFMEREIATGTARSSRSIRLHINDLRSFHCLSLSRASDMRLVSLTEIVQLRRM